MIFLLVVYHTYVLCAASFKIILYNVFVLVCHAKYLHIYTVLCFTQTAPRTTVFVQLGSPTCMLPAAEGLGGKSLLVSNPHYH